MFALRHHLKVLRSVVEYISVDVMYYLATGQGTTDHPFRNNAVHMTTEQLAIRFPFAATSLNIMSVLSVVLSSPTTLANLRTEFCCVLSTIMHRDDLAAILAH